MEDLSPMDFLNNNNLSESYNISSFISSGSWDTEFLEWSRIKLNPNEESYKLPISANYYTIGELVFFNIHLLITNPLSWGVLEKKDLDVERHWRFKLPFKKKNDWDLSLLSLDTFLDINEYSTNFISGRYVGKNTINVNSVDQRIEEKNVTAMFGIISFGEYLYLYALDSEDKDIKSHKLRNITSEWPVNFTKNYDSFSYLRLSISGIYRKEI